MFFFQKACGIFRIISPNGAIVRKSKDLDSDMICILMQETIVRALEVKKKRMRITMPVNGWISIENREGYKMVVQTQMVTDNFLTKRN